MTGQSALQRAIAVEQAGVDRLYARLDVVQARTEADLLRARRASTTGTPAARVEQEAFVRLFTERLAALRAAEDRLVFGSLALDTGEMRAIGRVGLVDDAQQSMLTDWRARAAEPFYQATGAHPMGVRSRRHISLRDRTVIGVEDDVLDVGATDDTEVHGSGALMAALSARRTGRMHDIVATIQAEQDRIIRAPLPGPLVVSGGPGCGKTVVALHRAAYLLYTHRDRLARSGVLIVGPNPLFLRYIEQVLPALGETAAVLTSIETLVPGVVGSGVDSDLAGRLKGDVRMAEALKRAVRLRQRVPEAPVPLTVEGTTVHLTPAMVQGARDRARAERRPHNVARRTFVLALLDRLVTALAVARDVDRESYYDLLVEDLRASPDVRREVNLCWMPLTPERLLRLLWSDEDFLAQAASHLGAADRRALLRPVDASWTAGDVPLLDEAAELLGADDEEDRRALARAAAARAADVEYARGVLEMTGDGGVTAEQLVDRYAADSASAPLAERAAADRSWVYGHVVVDEAQELTPMAWRVLMRRCTTRSMTIVGDLAQSANPSATSWADILRPYVDDRWRHEELTVNYRTPSTVMALAASVLSAHGVAAAVPTSVREGQPVAFGPGIALIDTVRRYVAADDVGRTAVIAATRSVDAVRTLLAAALPDAVGQGVTALDAPVCVLTVRAAKGLEFDAVVLYEPAELLGESARPAGDAYVAITRTTNHLTVLHTEPLPPGF